MVARSPRVLYDQCEATIRRGGYNYGTWVMPSLHYRDRTGSFSLPAKRRRLVEGGTFAQEAADIRRIAELSGLRGGWVYDVGMNAWVFPGPGVAHKRATYDLPDPCPQGVSAWNSSHACLRQIDRDGWCKMHASAIERHKATMAKWHAEWDQQRDDDERARQIAVDLTELWLLACDSIGIERERSGTVHCRNAATAAVDSEALRAVLMAVAER